MIGPLKIVVLLLMVILGVLAAYNIYSFGYRLLLGTKYAYLGGSATHQVNEDNMAIMAHIDLQKLLITLMVYILLLII